MEPIRGSIAGSVFQNLFAYLYRSVSNDVFTSSADNARLKIFTSAIFPGKNLADTVEYRPIPIAVFVCEREVMVFVHFNVPSMYTETVEPATYVHTTWYHVFVASVISDHAFTFVEPLAILKAISLSCHP